VCFILAAGHGTLLSNGEALALVGILLGSVAAFFGQERFRPVIHDAQYGRWLSCHWTRFPLLFLGVAGLLMIAVAK